MSDRPSTITASPASPATVASAATGTARPDGPWDRLQGRWLRLAAGGLVPARWYEPGLPSESERAARTGRLRLEIVSHCWRYAHLLAHQLSSLVHAPPRDGEVRMSVYHAIEDEDTTRMLAYFGRIEVPGVTWDWRARPRETLFRRAIGRNEAALATEADWVWFTDCDVIFGPGCLDGLFAAVQGRRDALVYPGSERCTALLPDDHPIVDAGRGEPRTLELDLDDPVFVSRQRTRATGPLQITHGDVARAIGYCRALRHYQRPSPTWCKAWEDRAFRWLLRTPGTPLDVPGVARIRHQTKGRYTGSRLNAESRGLVRRLALRVKERGG